MDMPGWQFGVGRRKKLFLCSASPEHVESDSDTAYWVVGYRKGKGELKSVAELPHLALHFGLTLDELAGVPTSLRVEVAPWFVDSGYLYKWFSVRGGKQSVDYQFAIVLYLALYLRKSAGSRMFCMHLVSAIEGKPNARLPYWSRK